jgi:hypothetical protein
VRGRVVTGGCGRGGGFECHSSRQHRQENGMKLFTFGGAVTRVGGGGECHNSRQH